MMEVIDVFNKKVKEIILKENVYCVLLIGAGAKTEFENFYLLNDIDLFIITKDRNCFEREVVDIDGVSFDISYMSLDLLKKSILEKNSLIITALSNYKCIYNIGTKIDKLLDEIKRIYILGPEPIRREELDYIRFKLFKDYEDILTRLDDEITACFLVNNLFKSILISYFKLNRIWIPKDKKILREIEKLDLDLFSVCKEFLQENSINKKITILLEILDYVLKPFGGYLKYWNRGKFLLK
ncbi:hypothetical protein SAMN02745883_01067 [Caminicella sporogenes DSM 14501]|uniref:Nucleotidyltransferase domain-containing protein n=3 Tax=Caminicella TaxID=166484 RepID=A0A1M6P1J0_9FIRM|nr:hypothetical protein SAMN02745883_01067 [Caminicella sporogenes DSM 14501]